MSLISFFKQQARQAAGLGSGEAADEAEGGTAEADDEDLPVLTSMQAERLLASPEVRAAMRDPRLEAQLRHIDSAATREGALRRLERALLDADFELFTRTALREIGVTAAAEGER